MENTRFNDIPGDLIDYKSMSSSSESKKSLHQTWMKNKRAEIRNPFATKLTIMVRNDGVNAFPIRGQKNWLNHPKVALQAKGSIVSNLFRSTLVQSQRQFMILPLLPCSLKSESYDILDNYYLPLYQPSFINSSATLLII